MPLNKYCMFFATIFTKLIYAVQGMSVCLSCTSFVSKLIDTGEIVNKVALKMEVSV
jgi:hypothetical protein